MRLKTMLGRARNAGISEQISHSLISGLGETPIAGVASFWQSVGVVWGIKNLPGDWLHQAGFFFGVLSCACQGRQTQYSMSTRCNLLCLSITIRWRRSANFSAEAFPS
jgi:hypothetical protein